MPSSRGTVPAGRPRCARYTTTRARLKRSTSRAAFWRQQIQDREQVDLLTAMDQVDLDVLEPDYDYTFTRRNTNRPKPPSPAQLGQNITVHKP